MNRSTKEHSTDESYSRIVESTALIGGTQVVSLILGLVRSKVVAILLGPSGLGLLATFLSLRATAETLASLGIHQSGIRDVAKAFGTNDRMQLASTVTTLRRICWLCGLCGGLLLALFAEPISRWALESSEYSVDVAMLGCAVALSGIAGGLKATIRGTRRIKDLAKLNLISVFLGTLIAVVLYLEIGTRGIVPAIVISSFVDLVVSWRFSKKISLPRVTMTWWASLLHARTLLSLGLVFMWTGLLLAGVELAIRSMLTHHIGLFSVGIFAAAYRVSGLFVNMVTGAMASDFYPALAAASTDHTRMRQLVNDQTEIGLLLVAPGLLFTMALGPWMIRLFYSAEFLPAIDLLQWLVLGCLTRVISWPSGYILVAKGHTLALVMCGTVLSLLHLALVWVCLSLLMLEGVAIAFLIYNIAYLCVYMLVGKRLIGFSWSRSLMRLAAGMVLITTFVFIIVRKAPLPFSVTVTLIVSLASSLYCVREISEKLGVDHRLVRGFARVPFATRIMGVG